MRGHKKMNLSEFNAMVDKEQREELARRRAKLAKTRPTVHRGPINLRERMEARKRQNSSWASKTNSRLDRFKKKEPKCNIFDENSFPDLSGCYQVSDTASMPLRFKKLPTTRDSFPLDSRWTGNIDTIREARYKTVEKETVVQKSSSLPVEETADMDVEELDEWSRL